MWSRIIDLRQAGGAPPRRPGCSGPGVENPPRALGPFEPPFRAPADTEGLPPPHHGPLDAIPPALPSFFAYPLDNAIYDLGNMTLAIAHSNLPPHHHHLPAPPPRPPVSHLAASHLASSVDVFARPVMRVLALSGRHCRGLVQDLCVRGG